MGLAERRATKDFQDNRLPALVAELHKLAGFEVPLEIAWDQLAKADQAGNYGEFWPKVYFQPLIDALTDVARDDMGKEALKGGLTKIVLANTSDYYSPGSAISFTGGVLTIDHDPCCNVDDIGERSRALVKALEQGL